EGAVGLEDLDAVVDAVGDVYESVLRERHVMRQAELLRQRRVRIVGTEVLVVRLVSVSAPHAFEGERLGVDHDDAAVAIAIRDIELVVGGIDREVGGAAKVLRVGAAAALALTAELRQELALRGELEDLV